MATPAQQAAAMARRKQRFRTRVEWFGDRVQKGIKIGMLSRLKIAAQLLRDAVVINISRPVTKLRHSKSGRRVVDPASRSKPGEYPKADTTRLMKDIFWQQSGALSTMVGTTLDYGLILETRMNRSFLLRTMNEQRLMLQRILIHGTPATARFPGETE